MNLPVRASALYEADKIAHEEAAKNGGVRLPPPFRTHDNSYLPASYSFTGTEYPTLKRASTSPLASGNRAPKHLPQSLILPTIQQKSLPLRRMIYFALKDTRSER